MAKNWQREVVGRGYAYWEVMDCDGHQRFLWHEQRPEELKHKWCGCPGTPVTH